MLPTHLELLPGIEVGEACYSLTLYPLPLVYTQPTTLVEYLDLLALDHLPELIALSLLL